MYTGCLKKLRVNTNQCLANEIPESGGRQGGRLVFRQEGYRELGNGMEKTAL